MNERLSSSSANIDGNPPKRSISAGGPNSSHRNLQRSIRYRTVATSPSTKCRRKNASSGTGHLNRSIVVKMSNVLFCGGQRRRLIWCGAGGPFAATKGSASSLVAQSPELTERLQQFHCRLVLEAITFKVATIQALEVGRQRDSALHQENHFLSIERHGCADFDEDVVIDLGVFVAVLVQVLTLSPDVNHACSAGAHVLKHFLGNRYR